nr:replication protein [Tabrizicola sp.]
LDYAADPGTATDDPDKAVAILFKSAGYQKRSYVRTFIPVVERLGGDLLYPQDIPRALGLALARRLDEVPGLVQMIRTELKGWDTRSVMDELAVLRRFAGAEVEAGLPTATKAPTARIGSQGTAKTSFQFDRAGGRAMCLAAVGKLEIRLDRDFTTIDRRRLEQAVRLMLDLLEA